MATLKDIATAAKVGKSTVSYVLNGQSEQMRIADKTRIRVEHVAKKMGYIVDDMARSIKTGKSNVIAFVYNHMSERLFNGINRAARKNNFLIKSFYISEKISQKDSSELFKVLKAQRIAGVIFHHNHRILDDLKEKLFAQHIPVISSCPSKFPGNAMISSDENMGTKLVADYIYQMGHRNIGCVGILPDDQASSTRISTFKSALKERNIALKNENIIVAENKDQRIKILEKLLSLPEHPSVLFCTSDQMAIAVLSVAASLGLKVPEDLSLVGYGDSYIADCIKPSLTTVAEKHYEVGKHTCTKLIELTKSKSREKFQELLDVELIIRDSVKRLKTR